MVDGDTVVLAGLGKSRLIGVDTPEVYGRPGCFGREASAFTKQLLHPGDRVRYQLGREQRDRFRRPLIYLWLGDGRFVNEMLIAGGYAVPLTIPPNDDYAARFKRLADLAARQREGLWSSDTCNGNPGRASVMAIAGVAPRSSTSHTRAAKPWGQGGPVSGDRPRLSARGSRLGVSM